MTKTNNEDSNIPIEELVARHMTDSLLLSELKRRLTVISDEAKGDPRFCLEASLFDGEADLISPIFESDDLESLESLGEAIWNLFIEPAKSCVDLADRLIIEDDDSVVWEYDGDE